MYVGWEKFELYFIYTHTETIFGRRDVTLESESHIHSRDSPQLIHTLPRPSEISEKNWSTGKASFDIPCMIQSHAESMKKILGAL